MGFADGYLHKHALRQRLIKGDPDPDLKIIITIPCFNESGLVKSLDSLYLSGSENISAEVIILINAAENSPARVMDQNRKTYHEAVEWIGTHQDKNIRFFPILDNSFPSGKAGVGLARKIAMDEALHRFNLIDNPSGIILSFDADAMAEPGYMERVYSCFQCDPGIEGCSIYFEHPLSGDEFDESVYRAVSRYELHLRYYVRATRFTGYPYAHHTVGSCFGIMALAYCRYGGMNRRQGGEDFYFIQKVAQNGRFSDCTTTRIIPSPRPSDRVPFGTGPAVQSIISKPEIPYLTYNPEGFIMLAAFFETIKIFSVDPSEDFRSADLHPILSGYLEAIHFNDALAEIIANTASPGAFMKRFWRYFNMFRILKFLHFAREQGIEDVPVETASLLLLELLGIESKADLSPEDYIGDKPEKGHGINREKREDRMVRELLNIYRSLDRGTISYPPQ